MTLKDNQAATSKNFGSTQLAVVNGTLFDDLDADAVKDTGEGALPGWTVFADADKDGTISAAEFGKAMKM